MYLCKHAIATHTFKHLTDWLLVWGQYNWSKGRFSGFLKISLMDRTRCKWNKITPNCVVPANLFSVFPSSSHILTWRFYNCFSVKIFHFHFTLYFTFFLWWYIIKVHYFCNTSGKLSYLYLIIKCLITLVIW